MRLFIVFSFIFASHLSLAKSVSIFGPWTLSAMYCENGTPLNPELKVLSQKLIQSQMTRDFNENGTTKQSLNLSDQLGVKCLASASATYEINSVIGFSNVALKIDNCLDENLEDSMNWFGFILNSLGYYHEIQSDGTLLLYSLVLQDAELFCGKNERLIEAYTKKN